MANYRQLRSKPAWPQMMTKAISCTFVTALKAATEIAPVLGKQWPAIYGVVAKDRQIKCSQVKYTTPFESIGSDGSDTESEK